MWNQVALSVLFAATCVALYQVSYRLASRPEKKLLPVRAESARGRRSRSR